MSRIRGAFGPAELIFIAGLASLAIGLAVLLPAAAFIAIGLILLGVGWRWQESAGSAPVEPDVEPAAETVLAELGYRRAA